MLFVIPLAATLPIIGCSHTETTPTTQTVTVTASPSPQPDLFEGSALDGYTYKLCDSQAAQATPVTSCEFSIAVAQAFRYLGNRGGNVHAHSPVHSSGMTCTASRATRQELKAGEMCPLRAARVAITPSLSFLTTESRSTATAPYSSTTKVSMGPTPLFDRSVGRFLFDFYSAACRYAQVIILEKSWLNREDMIKLSS